MEEAWAGEVDGSSRAPEMMAAGGKALRGGALVAGAGLVFLGPRARSELELLLPVPAPGR